jgi:hypothetical protein
MTGSGTLALEVTYDPADQTFYFDQAVNATGNNIGWTEDDGLQVDVKISGAYSLAFAAANFDFADPPIVFEGGAPSWLVLQQGYDEQQFTLLLINAGFVLEKCEFSIQEKTGLTFDPTVVNNPNPPTVAAAELKPGRKRARA